MFRLICSKIKLMRTSRSVVALFLVVSSAVVLAADLPPAPDGFTWQEVPDIKAAVLKPQDGSLNESNRRIRVLISLLMRTLTRAATSKLA